MNLKIHEVSFHRNGVSGEGFYAILFNDAENGNMLGILFDNPGQCAVICRNLLDTVGVKFGRNSWRGDHYEAELRKAIKTHESSGSVRIGPFGIAVP